MKIEEKIKEFILHNLYFSEGAVIEDGESFLETGVVDSTGVMELVAFVETEFGIRVEQEEIVVDNFDSVSKVASFIRRKLRLPEDEPALTESRKSDTRSPLAGKSSPMSVG